MTLPLIQRVVLKLYGWAMWTLIPIFVMKIHRRAKAEPVYGQHWRERLGRYEHKLHSAGLVWIHAVSLGESRAAGLLIQALRQQYPQIKLLLTHGTATGWQEGTRHLQAGDIQVWQPWDAPSIVRCFLQIFQPQMGILMETEVWPQLVDVCKQRGIPLYLVNARLNERSYAKSLRIKSLMVPAYSRIQGVLAQSQEDADRFRGLGAHVTQVLGNLKYDVVVDRAHQQLGKQWRTRTTRPVIMLASSRQGEELLLLKALKATSLPFDRVQWLIVPRHPQRFEEVVLLLQEHGFNVQRRSLWQQDGPPSDERNTIWVGDSIGEMQIFYHMATMALLGGSFEPFGGQNLIEAAACGCPTLLGPHTFNFSEAANKALFIGAAWRVGDMTQALDLTSRLLDAPYQVESAQAACEQWLTQSRGASEQTASYLISNLV